MTASCRGWAAGGWGIGFGRSKKLPSGGGSPASSSAGIFRSVHGPDYARAKLSGQPVSNRKKRDSEEERRDEGRDEEERRDEGRDGSDVICTNFASQASAWLDAYDGSIAGKTPPLSEDLINAGCGPYRAIRLPHGSTPGPRAIAGKTRHS